MEVENWCFAKTKYSHSPEDFTHVEISVKCAEWEWESRYNTDRKLVPRL